jgi:hypothetical protein
MTACQYNLFRQRSIARTTEDDDLNASDAAIGSVAALWRYPVKSMQGEELGDAPVTARGILGDRAYAVRDRATGHIASAKHPRKWGALFACQAAFVEPPRLGAPLPPVWITLPDGAVVHSAQPDVDRALARAIGRANAAASVALASGSMLDAVVGAYASVVCQGTLRRGDAVWVE